jgi:hypothetical protein
MPSANKKFLRARNDAAHFVGRGNVLNLCTDSKRPGTVTFLTTIQNKFIKRLSWNKAESSFRTTLCHYADKLLRKRVFFCSSEQGNPADAFEFACAQQLQFQN